MLPDSCDCVYRSIVNSITNQVMMYCNCTVHLCVLLFVAISLLQSCNTLFCVGVMVAYLQCNNQVAVKKRNKLNNHDGLCELLCLQYTSVSGFAVLNSDGKTSVYDRSNCFLTHLWLSRNYCLTLCEYCWSLYSLWYCRLSMVFLRWRIISSGH